MRVLIIALLVACGRDNDDHIDSDVPVAGDWAADAVWLPGSPADPLRVDLENGVDFVANAVPMVENAAGNDIPLEQVEWVGESFGFRPSNGWDAGIYYVTGTVEERAVLDEAFEVRAASNDQPPAGTAWSWKGGWMAHGELTPLLLGLGSLVVQIDEVDGENVTFSIYVAADGYDDCLAFRDVGTFVDGALIWKKETWDVDWDGINVPVHGLALDMRWLDDGTVAGQLSAGLETAPMSLVWFPGDVRAVCDMAGQLGLHCYDCPEGDGDTCLGVSANAMAFIETESRADAPMCGVDQTAVQIPIISCDMPTPNLGCGCSTAEQGGMPGLFVLLIAFLRRRRPDTSKVVHSAKGHGV